MNDLDRDSYRQLKEHLIDRARGVAEFSSSYRHFKVGAAVLAWSPVGLTPSDHYRIFTAANVKVGPEPDDPKECAEAIAVCYARSNGYQRIIAIAVAGEPQLDEDSGLHSPTLHPCARCRRLFKGLKEVSGSTYVVTARNHEGVIEEHSFRQILKKHRPKKAA